MTSGIVTLPVEYFPSRILPSGRSPLIKLHVHRQTYRRTHTEATSTIRMPNINTSAVRTNVMSTSVISPSTSEHRQRHKTRRQNNIKTSVDDVSRQSSG